jgi:hypothetical protein
MTFVSLQSTSLRTPLAPRFIVALVAMIGALGVVACDATGPEGDARVQIQLTDAPADHIESARVWISRVYLQGGDDDGEGEDGPPGRVDLFNDPENPREYDLLDLQNGIVADLTDPVDVESGTYAQLRLVVDSAHIALVAGLTFANGDAETTLFVPSGSQSGIKVQLMEPIEATADDLTIVLVDFDVDQNFVFQGPMDAPTGVLFTPTLKQIEPAGES